MKSITSALTLFALIAAPAQYVLAAALPPQTRCTIAKLRASSAAFQCALKEGAKTASGATGDPNRCVDKLASKFASAEARGGCPTSADASVASSRAQAAAEAVLTLLGEGIASTDDELSCLRKKAKLAAIHARCQTAALSTRLSNSYIGERPDFAICREAHAEDSTAEETDHACAVVGESESVREASSAGFAYAPGGVWGFRLDHAPLAGAYLIGSDFSNATLAAAHLRGADLSQSTLTSVDTASYWGGPADLRDTDFSGATLEGVNFDGCLLDGAVLATASIGRIKASELPACPASLPPSWDCIAGVLLGPTASLGSVDLSGLDLSGVDLSHAGLEFTNLENAILHDVDLSQAYIQKSRFAGADMTGADLSNAQLDTIYGTGVAECPAQLPGEWDCLNRNLVGPRAVLTSCYLAGEDLSGMNLSFTRFTQCDVSGADLSGATLISTSLSESNFTGANLDGSYIRDSQFTMTDFTGASFAGASIDFMDWVHVTCPDGVNTDVSYTCCGHHIGGAPALCDD